VFYRLLRSIRARPNAWLLALGMALTIWPTLNWGLAADAYRRMYDWDGDGLPGEPRVSASDEKHIRWTFEFTHSRPYEYAMFGGWALGPAIIFAAGVRVLVSRRRRNSALPNVSL
jgi:hypothetical protein